MNDSMSVLLATTILALGGFGLYMYKSPEGEEKHDENNEEYNEDGIFGKSGFFNWGKSENDENNDENDTESSSDISTYEYSLNIDSSDDENNTL